MTATVTTTIDHRLTYQEIHWHCCISHTGIMTFSQIGAEVSTKKLVYILKKAAARNLFINATSKIMILFLWKS